MDPTTNLTRQRELASAINDADDTVDRTELASWADQLADLVLALDEWRINGGFDPYTATEDYDLTNPPWAAPPYNGDSDKWGDEQDRSEWFEAAASYWAGRALAAETTAEPEEEATHAVTLTLSLDPATEMGDNAPKTFHEAARLMLTVVDGPLPPGAIHPIRKAGRPTTELETHGR